MKTFLAGVIDPGLALLPLPVTQEARVLLLAIAAQESALTYTRQMGNGPARGYWQFEPAGLAGVQTHRRSRRLFHNLASAVSREYQDSPSFKALHELLAHEHPFAAAVARLLLYTDDHALPALGDESDAWRYYLRLWRPGRPRPEKWAGLYANALAAVRVTGNPMVVSSC